MVDRPQDAFVKFGDVVREVTEHDRTPIENGLDRYVGLDHLDPHSLKIKRWGLLSEGTTFTKRFREGQVLFGRRRAYQRKAAVPDFDGICSGDILVFEAKPEYLLPELLPFLVHTDAFFDYALGTSSGSLSPRTKWSSLATFQFYLPPIARQEELVELFQAIEDAIAATEESIAAAEQLKRSLMDELLTKGIGHTEFKQTELGEIPATWEIKPLSKIALVERGKFTHRPRNEPAFYGGDIPFIQTADVVNSNGLIKAFEQTLNERGLSISKKFKKGTIVITIAANIGYVGILDIDACFPDSLCGITPFLEIDRDFLYYYLELRQPELDSLAPESAQKNLNLETLKLLMFVLPPKQEQQYIAKLMLRSTQTVKDLEQHRIHTNGLKKNLVNALLSEQVELTSSKLNRELVGV